MNADCFSFRNAWLIGKGVLLEAMRRREFWVLCIFGLVFLAGVAVVRIVGVENPETAAFILNLGLSLALGAAQLLTILTAARQLPAEFENRTIYPILAKPVGRAEYLVGKWWACTAAGLAALALLSGIAWIPAPHVPGTSAGTMVQMMAAGAASLGVAAAVALLLSLAMPQAVNIVLCGLVVWFGGKAADFVVAHAGTSGARGAAQWVAAYVPDFGKLNLVTRYTDGIGPLPAGEFAALAAYAAVLLAFCHAAAFAIFRRRAI